LLYYPLSYQVKIIIKNLINKQISQLIPYSHPLISQIIPSSKYLQIIPIRNQLLNILINLSRLLTLPSTITKDNVTCYIASKLTKITLITNKTRLFCMLKIKSMPLCYSPIHSLLHPIYRIYNLISPLFLHRIYSPLEFRVNHPHK
jgi:hypothetical protein